MTEQNGFSATAAGTDSGASATFTNPKASAFCCVTAISGHTDENSLLQILEENGTTVLWQGWIPGVTSPQFHFTFPDGIFSGTAGNNVIGKIVTSLADCQVTISGHWR